jgi:SAM-dependent methyltransferase
MCKATAGALVFSGGDLLHPGPERFRLERCSRCGHLYQNPRPTEASIDRYYPSGYISFERAIEDEPSLLRRLERRYGSWKRSSRIERAAGRIGRLLDVGCATGIFLASMRHAGWQVEGVEPSPSASTYARERLGLKVLTGRLEEAHYPEASFDVVTLWDVLEHVHEPRPVIAEAARILRPGGLLIVSVPNPDSIEARLLGEHWLGWDLPRHLNLFSPPQLRSFLASEGLSIEQTSSFMEGYGLLVMSLEQRWQASGRRRDWLLRLLRSLPVRLIAKLYYSGPANWFNLSSTMIIFARKKGSPRPNAE